MQLVKREQKLDYDQAAFELKKNIPELYKVYYEHIVDHLRGSGLRFYKEDKVKTTFLFRLTLIPAILLMVVLFVGLPINYLLTGKWHYDWNWLVKWFRMLNL